MTMITRVEYSINIINEERSQNPIEFDPFTTKESKIQKV